jgi:hypothetical protein
MPPASFDPFIILIWQGFETRLSPMRGIYLLLITYYSLLITHYSLLITHYSLLITHYSLLKEREK